MHFQRGDTPARYPAFQAQHLPVLLLSLFNALTAISAVIPAFLCHATIVRGGWTRRILGTMDEWDDDMLAEECDALKQVSDDYEERPNPWTW